MRKHLTHIGMAVLLAAIAVGCSNPSSNNPDHGRYATEGGRKSGPPDQYVKLDGCLEPGDRPDGAFMLRQVVVPEPATQPLGQETMEHRPIPPGSWVRLIGDAGDLKRELGHRVEVTGRVEDSGENTMGTSGHEGSNDDKFRRSSHDAGTNPDRNITPTTAAPAGANANGLSPRIAVEHVRKLADSCEAR